MKALLRPAFVLGLSIAIAATSLIGSSSVALAASRPLMTTWSLSGPVYEGDRPSVNATFTDVDLTDLHTVDISWGDDTYDSYTLPMGARSFSVQKTVAYANDTSSELLIFITLSDPIFSNSKTLPVTVLNAAPSITSFGLSATEMEAGQAVTATGAFTDGGANTHTVKLDWNDGSPLTTLVLAPGARDFTTDAHTYAAVGNYTVSVTVTDDALAWDGATSTLVVRAPNQAPSIVSFGVTAGNEGAISTLALTFADADATDTHTVGVAWGDGSTTNSPVLASSETTFDATHVYADAGNYTVVMTLNDSAGHTVTASADVVVLSSNSAPAGLAFDASATGANVVVTGSFTDPDTTDTHTVALNWGDGFTAEVAANGTTFTASHVYGTSGRYTVTATVTDHPAGASTEAVSKQVDVTVPATSASDVIDEMSWLVRNLDLDRNTERWLLKKLGDLHGSLAYGNGQVCSSSGTLDHIMNFAQRTLEHEQYAALSAFVPQLQAAAGCTTNGVQQSPKVQRAAAVTTTVTPASTQKKDATTKDATTKDAAKAAKSDSKATAGRGNSH